MKSMITLFAALTLMTVAVAAEADELGTWRRNLPAEGTTDATGGAPEIVTGNNFFHASYCVVFMDGSASAVCVLGTPAENIIACTTNTATQTGMLTACQTGNLVAIYIPNAATGVFTQFFAFGNK